MELFLNLLWLVVAAVGLCKVWLDSRAGRFTARHSTFTALLTVGCLLILLFPIISASDDLHGDQALAEDALKRVGHSFASLQQVKQFSHSWLFLCLLSLLPLFSLAQGQSWKSAATTADSAEGHRSVRPGRAPPKLSVSHN